MVGFITHPVDQTGVKRSGNLWLTAELLLLSLGLAVNTVVGPFLTGGISYPLAESVRNMIIGLEAVSLLLVVPIAALAALLVFREDYAGPVVAIPPSAYAAYMSSQYILGPQYVEYSPVVLLHLGIFILSGTIIAQSWQRIRIEDLPHTGTRRNWISTIALFMLAGFASVGYIAALPRMVTGGTIPAMYVEDPTVYWSIFFIDLGILVPLSLAVGVGLLQDKGWARKAVHSLVGFYALVIISIAGMFIAMADAGDPNAPVAVVLVLTSVSLLVAVFAVWVFKPLFRQSLSGGGGQSG